MRKTSITESDIAAVAAKLEQIAPDIPTESDSRPNAVKVIDCVLARRANYYKVVRPRLETFRSVHPDIRQVAELANRMASYPSPHAFMKQELNYNSEQKARILQEVVKFVCQIVQKTPNVPEEETLKHWARQVKPQECHTLNIKYFKLASFQHLRKLFGANTAKPDVHVIRFISAILHRDVSDLESLNLLEAASERAGLSIREVDSFIWERGARGTGTNEVVRQEGKIVENTAGSESSSEYSKFWEPIRRERLFQGKPVHDPSFIKTINGIYLLPELRNHRCQIRMSFEGENRSERRAEIMKFFPESEYNYKYRESRSYASVIFPVLDKGIKDRGNWDEMRGKLVSMGTDIYNKINESDT